MSLFSKLFVTLGVFLLGAGVIYGVLARDYEGLVLSLTAAGGALLFGWYGRSAVRRARTTLVSTAESAAPPAGSSARPAAADPAADAEPHVGPTIWPLVFAVSAIGLVLGAVSARWVLLPGAVLFVLAGVGWVLDVHRQWHHHAAGLSGHGSGVLESVEDIHAEPGVEPGAPMGPSTGPAPGPGEPDTPALAPDVPPGHDPAAVEDGRRR